MSPVWEKILDDKTGKEYYYNTKTGVSQWERPGDYETKGADAASSTAASEPSAFIPSEKFAGAKPGYLFKSGPEGVGYYIDPRTRGSQEATVSGGYSSTIGSAEANGNGKGEWTKHFDEKTKHYYWYNATTGQSKWVAEAHDGESHDFEGENEQIHSLKSTKDDTAATIASWLPVEVRNAPSLEHKNPKNPKTAVPGADDYSATGTFIKRSGEFDNATGMTFWERQGKPEDRIGRQMNYYYDLSTIETNRREAMEKKKRLQQDKSIDWKSYAKKQKKKRFLARNQWLFED